MELFARIIAPDTLRRGWDRVKANAGGPGGDGMTLGTFEIGLENRLHGLHLALLEGDYWPAPVRIAEIPKRRGGIRTLRIPSVADRVVQSAAALILTPILDEEFEDSSFAYRPGRSVQQAVARVAALRREGYVWTVDGDIEDFFDSVRHDRLLARLESATGCEQTTDLVERWLEAYCEHGTGLPQGAPISPLLANLYLDDIDERIARGGVRLVRFADDFLLLCRSEMAAKGARARMAELLEGAGLRLHPGKARIVPFEQATRFLGHLFLRGLAMREEHDEEDGLTEPPPPGRLGRRIAEPEAEADDGLSARVRWLHIHEPGRVVARRNMGLSIRDGRDGPELAAVQPDWADAVELGAAVQIEDDALRLLMADRIPVSFLAGDGSLLATMDPAPAERAALHLDQARHVLDPALRTALACRFVAGRIWNQRALLKRLNRRLKKETTDKAAHDIGRLARLALVQPSPEEAMGVEGRATALYWPALGACLNRPVKFDTRERRPPPDPANLVLSFLSTRLAGEVAALITRRGLHPGFACLHASQDGRPSLALDLMEEFRAPLAEGLMVTLFNRRVLKPGQFAPAGHGALRAAPEAVRSMIRAWQKWIMRPVKSPHSGKRISWRGLIEEQILAYMRHVQGHETYQPYRMDY